MRLLVVQHVSCEGLGLLKDKLINDGWELDIRSMDIAESSLPDSLAGYHAFIILGGPMGAYEENVYPYLYQVEALVRQAAAGNIPTLGICLGGQIIARALGAEVGPNPQKEIGWYFINTINEDKANLLFHNLPSVLPVFQWHGDTFSLPEGAILLASSEACQNQAFVYRNNIWALQFHLEVDRDMIKIWSEIYNDELTQFGGPGAATRLQRNTQARWEGMDALQEKFINNILAILQGDSGWSKSVPI
jgi:GMP synthase (glutamine-hydrolysing)